MVLTRCVREKKEGRRGEERQLLPVGRVRPISVGSGRAEGEREVCTFIFSPPPLPS